MFWITFVLQIAKLFVFSFFGSGDVQSWDSYNSEPDLKTLRDVETQRRARFTVAGDSTESDESADTDSYVDNNNIVDSSDSELLLK